MALEKKREKLLILKSQNGDISAFTQLVREYERQIFTFVVRNIPVREDAEDLTQEIFIKAYKGLKTFRGDALFSTWLYTIAKNTCYHYSQKKRYQMVSLDYAEDRADSVSILSSESASETIEAKEDFQILVIDCLKRLPHQYNTVVQLYYYQQFRYQEISEILQIPLSTVKIHLHRAIKMLREMVMKKLESSRGEE